MKLKIQNIGKIRRADIAIDGITVLTGDNDTGKSTVGKVLYCLFDTFHNAKENVFNAKKKTLRALIYTLTRDLNSDRMMKGGFDRQLYRQISEVIDESITLEKEDRELFKKGIKSIFSGAQYHLSDSELANLYRRYDDIVELTDSEVLEQMLHNELQAEFGTSDIMTINVKEKSEINLSIKNQTISLKSELNHDFKVKQYIDLVKRIIYIDDPFILDNIDANRSRSVQNHRGSLLNMLSEKSKDSTAVSEIVTQKRLQPIMQKLQKISDGDLIHSEQEGYQYQSAALHGAIPIKEVSTGIKSFLILKQLLISGQLEENGIVVLDEPEVHLHPQWQVAFSEIIIMLHQQFHINFLITTHSIDFLSAIEFYSKKYDVVDKCHYYLMEKNGKGDCTFSKETSGHLDEAYAKLSEPFLNVIRQLEDE